MDYLLHVLVMVALFAILATSFNLLIGYSGLFALSHAAFFGIGAYATAIVALKLGLPFPMPLLMGLAVTAVAGVVIAVPALRISGDYLVIVSLALQVIVIAVMLNWTGLTGGTDGIRGIPRIQIFGASLDTAAKFLPLSVIVRSEEHTSELQSREKLVCRLLLEKKKNSRHRLRARSRPP